MTCTPHEIWVLAGRLAAEPGADEATLRSAVSRAYYAAHLRVRAVFPEDPAHPRGRDDRHEGVHEYVIRRAADYAKNTANSMRREASTIAIRLDHCKRERNFSDYRIDRDLMPAAVREQLKRVELILALCEKVSAEASGS